MAYGFLIDTSRCYGCKTCAVACAFGHDLPLGVLQRHVREYVQQKPPGQAFLSIGCNHCDKPSCIAACPVRAYSLDDVTGLVVQNHTLCIGCKACIDACPFRVPVYYETEATVYKCDGCTARVAKGLDPICVATCPANALQAGDYRELLTANPDAYEAKAHISTAPNLAIRFTHPLNPGSLTEDAGN
ncbi:MAG: 4Fe-4S dicluster domain-containing protein [Coriobacteriales bacterium]|nr:4Fe-4S dicluster domain-containing protein [Coriobacteriales bacterium]